MAKKFLSERNLDFMLYEVHDVERLSSLPYYEDHNRETYGLVVDTALKLARNMIFPYLREMDEKPPYLEDGQVKVIPEVKSMMKQWGEGGWMASSMPYEVGGQQLPVTVSQVCEYAFAAANFAASAYRGLTTGAAHLILSFATAELIEAYTPSMLAGEWQGTMALTEPQAGSSLSDIITQADPTDQGYYKIRGQKISSPPEIMTVWKMSST